MHHCIPLLAFGFGNLAMLGWLAAAAAPLLIHLWSRRKFREVPWAAVTFLLAATRRTSRRIQLQQWLLLAVRTLIIVLVVLAVAEPYGVGTFAGSFTGGPAHKLLVVDGSYSMAYRAGESTLFANAKRLAAQLVRDSAPVDTFTLIRMAEPATTILDRDVIDHAAVIGQIESLTQSHSGADLSTALSRVEESLNDRPAAPGGAHRKEVYFFTDLQRRTWDFQDTESATDESTIGKRLAALAKRARVVVVDLGIAGTTNLAVTQLSTTEPFATTAGEVTIDATLHQFGDQPQADCVVELLVDDEPVAEQSLNIPAGSDAAVRFAFRFRTAGDHSVAVRARGDSLEIDNSRWLVVPVRDEVRVLCVAGKPGAAKFVADALDPDPTDASPVRPLVVSEGDLAELELTNFDCVFLCNVGHLTPGEAERLTRYTSAGGGIVIFLGDQAHVETYHNAGRALLPARIGGLAATQQFGVDPLEYRHPIVAPFRGREGAGLLTTPVSRYYRLNADRPGAEVVAALAGGDPWIVAAPLGRGRTVLVSTDGSLSSVDDSTGEPWTVWPTWPSFLPIVREMLAYTVGGQKDAWQQPVGSTLSQRGREPLRIGDMVEIVRPDRSTASVHVESSLEGGAWTYDATDLSGIYKVRPARGGEPQPHAVNLDTVESDLSKVDIEQLPSELLIRTTPQAAGDNVANDLSSRSGWQQSLLAVTFGLLILESALAWRFGRGVL